MFEVPSGIVLTPQWTRARQVQGLAGGAIATSGQPWAAVDLYFSDLRDDYLAGRFKQVVNMVNLQHAAVNQGYSLVWTREADRPAIAARHRTDLLDELAAQYKNAVARAIGGNPKTVSRRRYRANAELGSASPHPDAVDRYFAGHDAALEQCRAIRNCWTQISGA